MRRRALVLVNRGARRGAERLDSALEVLRDGIDLVDRRDAEPRDLAQVIRGERKRVDLVILGGGDGTLSAALPALLELGKPLGVLPLGTANNLARTLDIPTDLDEAARIIVQGHSRRIDVGQVNDRHFLTTASLGLSVRITQELTTASKRRWGPLAYGLAALRTLRGGRDTIRAEVRYEGRVIRVRALQVVVGNGRYYGSGMAVAEDARIDDGRLDLYMVEPQPRWRLVLLLPALKRGSQGEKPNVVAASSSAFEIRSSRQWDIDVDGEIGASTPATFSVLPGALEVLVPGGAE